MNLRTIKGKIKSIGNVGQITRAMQLVSAVKMKKAQEKAILSRPYREALQRTISDLASAPQSLENSSLTIRNQKTGKKLAIIIASNKGLCGVYHFNLFRFIVSEIKEIKDYDFVVMGGKASQFLFHYGANIVADFSNKMPPLNNVSAIFRLAYDGFLSQKYQSVALFYNRFVNSMVFKPFKIELLPLNPQALIENEKPSQAKNYLVEPNPKQLIEELFSFYLENEIRSAVFDAQAAEHSARMIAMKNATDNSQELVYRLTLLRNHVRQEKITNELLDMNTSKLAVS